MLSEPSRRRPAQTFSVHERSDSPHGRTCRRSWWFEPRRRGDEGRAWSRVPVPAPDFGAPGTEIGSQFCSMSEWVRQAVIARASRGAAGGEALTHLGAVGVGRRVARSKAALGAPVHCVVGALARRPPVTAQRGLVDLFVAVTGSDRHPHVAGDHWCRRGGRCSAREGVEGGRVEGAGGPGVEPEHGHDLVVDGAVVGDAEHGPRW